jgi:glycerophosphoryl diester phosphodiesterase
MKLIAHRGWAAGVDENTHAAFARAVRDDRLSGVEFDVRRDPGSGQLVVSHDPPAAGQRVLTLDEVLAMLAPTGLELLVEIKEEGLAPAVVGALVAANLADRSVVFGFAKVARSFPWHAPRPVRLGVIVMYPWNLHRAARALRPDMLLLGWDAPVWTRVAFRAWWSAFSLDRLGRRHGVPVVVGIVQRLADLRWLARQGVHAAVCDMDRIGAEDEAWM